MKKSTKKLLIGSSFATVGLGVMATSYKLTENLLKMAMDRETPKSLNKTKNIVSGSTGLRDLAEQIHKASSLLESKKHTKVEIKNQKGLRLTGHWYENPNPKRVIIAMHGWRSSWSHDFCAVADFWYTSGCSVLYAEQQGQGNSDGDYMGFGLLERYDCLDWINWVNGQTGGNLPIYLGGISMGATTVLMASGFDLPQTVHGIVSDCGFTSMDGIWRHVTEKNLHLPYDIYSTTANRLCRKKINMSTTDYSTTQALENCKVPVLFIHGTDDHFVPIEMTYENYKACKSPKRLFVVPGAEHGLSYTVDTPGYEKTVTDFWHDFD